MTTLTLRTGAIENWGAVTRYQDHYPDLSYGRPVPRTLTSSEAAKGGLSGLILIHTEAAITAYASDVQVVADSVKYDTELAEG